MTVDVKQIICKFLSIHLQKCAEFQFRIGLEKCDFLVVVMHRLPYTGGRIPIDQEKAVIALNGLSSTRLQGSVLHVSIRMCHYSWLENSY